MPGGVSSSAAPRELAFDDTPMRMHLPKAFQHGIEQRTGCLRIVAVPEELVEQGPLPRDQFLGVGDMPIGFRQLALFSIPQKIVCHSPT
jgi:hypothetical protein